jgi:hypothetical protein
MNTSIAGAKGFLIDRILDQAKADGVALSDVEVRMLGFSEAAANSKDMGAAADFERDHDDEQFEGMVADLLRKVYERDTNAGLKEDWDRSLDALADEDWYLFVMLEKAGIVKTTTFVSLPNWRMLWGLVPAGVCVGLAIFIAGSSWSQRLIPNSFMRLGICVLLLLVPLVLNRVGSKRAE